MMERMETNEVFIIANGLSGTILEWEEPFGEQFRIYRIETRRNLPDGSVRKDIDWYFRNEFIQCTAFRIRKAVG